MRQNYGLQPDTINDESQGSTTIRLRTAIRSRMSQNRALGQSFDGFISQLLDLWKAENSRRLQALAGLAGGNQGVRGAFLPPRA